MGTGIIFFKKPSDTEQCNNTTEDIDSLYFKKVVEEIESGYKDKGLEAKALVLSEGDTAKSDVLYLKLRAEAFQNNDQADLLRMHNIKIEEKNKRFMINLKTWVIWVMVFFVFTFAAFIFFTEYLNLDEGYAVWISFVFSIVVSTIGAKKYKNYAILNKK